MLSLEFIKNHPKEVEKNLRRRGVSIEIEKILDLDKKRRSLILATDKLKNQRNIIYK